MWKRIALLALLPVPAPAASPIVEVICAPRDEMVQRLTVQYGARLTGQGIRDVEAVLEVWADPRGDWALVQSYADGRSCILAMGVAWDAIPDPA
jgi:hypothetical protein